MRQRRRWGSWSAVGIAVIVGGMLVACDAPTLSVGSTAPVTDLQPLSSAAKPVSLADYRGKVVLLDFWATWCGPCREAFPNINVLHQKYRDQGFEVIAVSNESKETIDRFIRANGYGFTFVRDPFNLTNEAYQVSGYPTSFVIGRDGKIAAAFQGAASPAELEEAITSALK